MNKTKHIDWSKYTPFERRVYQIVMRIPAGRVWTYAQVAKKLGNSKLARAVGNALGKNQDSPAIPCHRVVGYNSIGGFSLPKGIKRKIKLLKKEGYRYVA